MKTKLGPLFLLSLVIASGLRAQSIKGHTLGETLKPNCEEMAKRQSGGKRVSDWVTDCDMGNFTISDYANMNSLPIELAARETLQNPTMAGFLVLTYKNWQLTYLDVNIEPSIPEKEVLAGLIEKFGQPTVRLQPTSDLVDHGDGLRNTVWNLPDMTVKMETLVIKGKDSGTQVVMMRPGKAVKKGLLD